MTLTDTCPDGATFRDASRFVPPVLSVAPTEEPVSLDEAKAQCRVDGNHEDTTVFWRIIQAAREDVEFDTELALITQTRIQYLDFFPSGPIELRICPVQSVTSITYTDTSGIVQTLSASLYDTDLTARPGIIFPAYGQSWPSCREKLKSIAVTFVAGYGLANAVPAQAKQAILLKVASSYQNREMSKQETMSYDALVQKLKWRAFT